MGRSPVGYGKERVVDYSCVIQNLQRLICEQLEKLEIPGLAIALVEGQNLVWAQGFGFTDRSKTHPVTVHTPFSLQSSGKSYTATTFLMAASKGLIHLDDPLRKYYPEFRVNSRFGEAGLDQITFRHLLSHWAGLCHEAPAGNNYDTSPCTFEEHVQSIADTWLKYPVGVRWSYSNLGMDLAAYTLQRISGKPFSQYMQKELLEPLGMLYSTYNQPFLFSNGVYARGHRGPFETPLPLIPMLGAGGLFASVSDVARFISFHLAGGVIGGHHLIDENLLREMYQVQFPVDGQVCGYGLGLIIDRRFGSTILTHPGGGYGYQAVQSWIPEYNLGVAVVVNSGSDLHMRVHDAAMQGMIATKYGSIPEEQPLPFVNFPEVPIDPRSLHCLEGIFRCGSSLVSITENNGKLYLNGTQALRPYSSTEFTTQDGLRLAFYLDAHGRPAEIQILDRWQSNYFWIEPELSGNPGPNKTDWQKFVGIYWVSESSIIDYAAVSIRNGYLYISGWIGDVRLAEYQPGLFFGLDGEAVIFQKDILSYGNTRHTWVANPYGQAIELSKTDPGSHFLTEGALSRLSKAYLDIGEQGKADAVQELNKRIHS